jgi:hypothetical protein
MFAAVSLVLLPILSMATSNTMNNNKAPDKDLKMAPNTHDGNSFRFPLDGDIMQCSGSSGDAPCSNYPYCFDTGDYYEGKRSFSSSISGLNAMFVQCFDNGVTPGDASLFFMFDNVTVAEVNVRDVLTNKCTTVAFETPVQAGDHRFRISFNKPIPENYGALALGDW